MFSVSAYSCPKGWLRRQHFARVQQLAGREFEQRGAAAANEGIVVAGKRCQFLPCVHSGDVCWSNSVILQFIDLKH
jgi:hypothetical protein